MKYKKTPLQIFVALLILIIYTVVCVKFVTNRLYLHDLQVYYGAANDLIGGGAVYDHYYGLPVGFYKYAPFLLLFFSGLLWIPWNALLLIYPAFTFLAILVPFLFMLKRILNHSCFNHSLKSEQNDIWIQTSIITAVIIYNHTIYREISLGNINLVLIFLFVIFLQLHFNQKKALASFLLGIIVMIKPHFVILLPIQALFQNYRASFMSLFSISLCVLLPIPFLGFQKTLSLTLNWFKAVVDHNNASSYLTTKHTFQSFFANFFPIYASANADYFVKIILLSMITLLFILACFYMFLLKNVNKNFLYIFFITFSAALIPNIFLTDTEHFMYGIPFVSVFIGFACHQMRRVQEKLVYSGVLMSIFIALQYTPPIFGFRASSYMGLFYFILIIFGFISVMKRHIEITKLKMSPQLHNPNHC